MAAFAVASGISRPSRRPGSALSPSSRSAATNHCAAPAGARGAASQPRLDEDGDGRLVARQRALLEVVGAGRRRRPALLERGRRARVRLEPPRLAGRVVDGAAHERMPEAVAARDLGGAEQPGGEDLVERRGRLRRAQAAGRGGELELHGLADDRAAPGEPPRVGAERLDLLAERGRDRGGHAGRPGRTVRRRGGRRVGGMGGASIRARELREIEGVAAALAVEVGAAGGGDAGAEQRPGLLGGQRRELELAHPALARGGLERRGDPAGELARAVGERDQHLPPRRAAQHVGEQLERGVVGPVQVVEHDHDRAARGEALEQGTHRAVGTEALVLHAGHRRPLRAGERREHAGQLAEAVADEALDARLAERGDGAVERVDPHSERQLALELGRAARQHHVPGGLGAVAQLAQEPRLADARLPAEHEPAAPAAAQPPERRPDRRELPAAPDDPSALADINGGHAQFRPRLGASRVARNRC